MQDVSSDDEKASAPDIFIDVLLTTRRGHTPFYQQRREGRHTSNTLRSQFVSMVFIITY